MRFAEYCGNRSLYEVFSDQRPVAISDQELEWLQAPPQEFLDYARGREPLPNHLNPPDEANYKRTPTFLIQQVHRHWLTAELINRQLRDSSDYVMADLGAFPFSIDLSLREYFGRRNRIIATLNFTPPREWIAELAAKQIEVAYVNLDPKVQTDGDVPGMTGSLPFADGSVDFVSLAHVIEHLYHPQIALQESYRVLRPSGKMLVSTDNAFMLYGLLNFVSCGQFMYEPVEGTSAMAFHDWRGHVRFYTPGDLKTMLEAVGFRIVETYFYEVLYSSFIEEYFKHPVKEFPAWKVDLLTSIPEYRNEILLLAEKPSNREPVSRRALSASIPTPNTQTEMDLPSLNLIRPGREYLRYVPFVGTTFYHWYTPTTGNWNGHWPPPGGRPIWSGEVDFWMGQLKQTMMANLDALYVHLVDVYEPQRINFFRALHQLREKGWEVPKIAPFLDTFFTFRDKPVDVATDEGKDELVSHYIRFFEQYLSASDDPHAASYLLRVDGKIVLTSWWVGTLLKNVDQLTRADIESRLVAALGDRIPTLRNGIYMISTALIDPDFPFADEKMVAYSGYSYGIHSVHQGIDVWHVQPGYWDQNIRKPGYFMPRDGGKHYRSAWEAVVAVQPYVQRVYVESWNEYEEGSGIYAADVSSPWREPGMRIENTDVFSSDNDPFEYIRTTALGAGMINQRPLNDAGILTTEGPQNAVAGSEISLIVVVRNEGNASWSGAAGYALQVGDEPALAIDDLQNDIPLYDGIFRGRTVAFTPKMKVPEKPGPWTIPLCMSFKGTPFGQQGSWTVQVTVRDADSTAPAVNWEPAAQSLNATFYDPAERALLEVKNCARTEAAGASALSVVHRAPGSAEAGLLRAEIGRLALRISEQNEEIERLNRMLAEKRTSAEGENQLRQQSQSDSAALALRQLEIDGLKHLLDEKDATLAAVLNSKSWKATGILRQVAATLRGNKPRNG